MRHAGSASRAGFCRICLHTPARRGPFDVCSRMDCGGADIVAPTSLPVACWLRCCLQTRCAKELAWDPGTSLQVPGISCMRRGPNKPRAVVPFLPRAGESCGRFAGVRRGVRAAGRHGGRGAERRARADAHDAQLEGREGHVLAKGGRDVCLVPEVGLRRGQCARTDCSPSSSRPDGTQSPRGSRGVTWCAAVFLHTTRCWWRRPTHAHCRRSSKRSSAP